MKYFGRNDGDGREHDRFFKRVKIANLKHVLPEQLRHIAHESPEFDVRNYSLCVGLMGFCTDLGVHRNHGRIGARTAPAAIREQLANMAANGDFCISDYGDFAYAADLCEGLGSAAADDGRLLEIADCAVRSACEKILHQEDFLLLLGGGHESSLAPICALFSHLRAKNLKNLLVINFDAHLDIRSQVQHTSGNSFLLAHEAAKACGIELKYLCIGASEQANTAALWENLRAIGGEFISDEDFECSNLCALERNLAAAQAVYLSIDMDAFCGVAGVSAPAAGGISLQKTAAAIAQIAASKKLLAADICELAPGLAEGSASAKAAALLAARIISAVEKNR